MQIRDAISTAQSGLTEVFPETQSKELRLEGVEKSEDSKYWQVTFSYSTSSDAADPLSRTYKTVKLRNEDGELMGARTGFLFDAA